MFDAKYSLIMPRHAALTPTAMLASQRRADHARNTKVTLVGLPHPDQLINDSLLLSNPSHLGHKPRIIHHTPDVEPSSQGDEEGKEQVGDDRRILSKHGATEDTQEPVEGAQEQ